MAAGDVVSAIGSLAQYDYLTIRPAVGEEWLIHNIFFDNHVIISLYNGSSELLFEWVNMIGHKPWKAFHLRNGLYLRVQAQAAGVTTLAGYDGVQTK